MAYQAEIQPTINSKGEDSALRPTMGQETWGHANPLIDSMITGYNEALELYRTKFLIEHSDDVTHRHYLEDYLRRGKELIVDQTLLAIQSNSLPEVGYIAHKYSGEALRAIAEVYVGQRFEVVREERARNELAAAALSQTIELGRSEAHIQELSEDPDPATSTKFEQIISSAVEGVKEFSTHAFERIVKGPFFHSGSMSAIHIVSKNVEVEALQEVK